MTDADPRLEAAKSSLPTWARTRDDRRCLQLDTHDDAEDLARTHPTAANAVARTGGSTGRRSPSRPGILLACAAFTVASIAAWQGSRLAAPAPEPLPLVQMSLDVPQSQALLESLFVRTLDTSWLPVRWSAIATTLRCRTGTTARIDGRSPSAKSKLPTIPFELRWDLVDCRPDGSAGPRLDGVARIRVVPEDWGFSASIDASNLRLTDRDGVVQRISNAAVTWPPDAGDEPRPGLASAAGTSSAGGSHALTGDLHGTR